MQEKLLDVITKELLEKFGAGKHIPGSGSASAFQGLLSAQMLLTVIKLTCDPKRRQKYEKYIDKFEKISEDIISNIYPRLEYLFQLDNDEFDKVYRLRCKRDNEQDKLERIRLANAVEKALKPATEIPLEIAELCVKLGYYASYIFDHGYRSVRGDSGVALDSAISGIASCLFVVELNLSSISLDIWVDEVRTRKKNIKSNYEKLRRVESEKLADIEQATDKKYWFQQSVRSFQLGNLGDSIRSNSELESLVQRLQNTIWLQRDKIWKDDIPERAIDILKPDIILKKVMGFEYYQSDTLGTYVANGERFEIAGLIDKKHKLVQVSKNFSKETQNFTAAHELGHAILHNKIILHRDKPLDGSSNISKSREEVEANKFASYFLMPEKGVKSVFMNLFNTSKFVIDESTVLAFNADSVNGLRTYCQNLRGLARLLSAAEYYGGQSFDNLAKKFNVSVETMAIRLEELELLKF